MKTCFTMRHHWRYWTLLMASTLFLISGCDLGTYNKRLEERYGSMGAEISQPAMACAAQHESFSVPG